MTPQQKAIELYNRFNIDSGSWKMDDTQIKECALIAIEEIKLALMDNHDHTKCKVSFDFWEEVKIELEKI